VIQRATIDAHQVAARAASLLIEVVPDATVILFGSYARNTPHADSDLDLLVVEPVVANRRAEMVRLRKVLKPLGIPVDVLVVSRRIFHEWRDTPNTILHAAATEGRVLHEMA